MSKKKTQQYDENSIQVYDYPENIQKKPSMYIGDINIEGCTHMIREVVDNSVDEALNGFGNEILIKISNKNGTVVVEDYGRGIPPKAIEKAFCTIHSSGKFNNNEYSASAGTNGVGTTAVNALSESFIVESVREGKAYVQKFSNGLPITELKATGTKKKKSGTIVFFKPNKKFMKTVEFDIETIKNELSSKIYVLKGVKIILVNEDTNEKFEFYSPKGLSDFVKKYNKEPICNTIKISKEIPFDYDDGSGVRKTVFQLDMEFSYDKKSHTDLISFCNSLYMREGGVQETAFKATLTRFFKKYITDNKLLSKKDEKLLNKITGDNVVDGLVGIISIKHPDPIFENQTKLKLKSSEVNKIATPISEALEEFSQNNQKDMKNICMKIITSVRAAENARAAREDTLKKGENQFSIVSDLSKLANCISKDINENEILITEGRSASGTAKEARDKKTQAVYSLRGKMLNTINMEKRKVLENKECADLAFILTGIKNAIDENFNIEDLRYGKVIPLCDADVDGYHIAMLVMTYIFDHMRAIIETGHFYVAIPPLYSIIEKGKKRYFIDQEEYDEYIYKTILNNYNFITEDDKTLNTIKKITTVFNKYDELLKYIVNYANNNFGISKEVLLCVFDYCIINGATTKNVKKCLNMLNGGDIIFNANTNKYEGFLNDKYIFFELSDITTFITKTFQFIKKNSIPIGSIYYYNDDMGTEEYSLFTIEAYDKLIIDVTPKSRVRLKGLGEMDADELRDTTLDKDKRNLYKITIEDVEQAKASMDNFMDDNPKYVAFRKMILLKKQNQEQED